MQCVVARRAGCRLAAAAACGTVGGQRRSLCGSYATWQRHELKVSLDPSGWSRPFGVRRSLCTSLTALTPSLTAVEPGTEEQFVFPDFSDPMENDPAKAERLLSETLQRYVEAQQEEPGTALPGPTELLHRTLQQELKALQPVLDVARQPAAPRRAARQKGRRSPPGLYGTPAPHIPASDSCCSGCGAPMHCRDPGLAGYLPSEKYLALQEEGALEQAVCQRCFLLVHHRQALDITVSKEEYRAIVGRLRNHPSSNALVLLMVDLLDVPSSIVSDLLSLVGEQKHIVVLGNKIDLLPGDCKNYLKRIRQRLFDYCVAANIKGENIQDVHLISAKTGYGVENLISSLQSSWKYKGDVYLVGTTNAGKSTLFNTLLESDYCKSKASDVIRRATISPWPGTTLNLLKFPVINPTPYRMFRRLERLKADAAHLEEDLSEEEQRHLSHLKKQGYLIGRIGRTFRNAPPKPKDQDFYDFDLGALSLSIEDEKPQSTCSQTPEVVAFTHNELKDAHWFYDTPGIVKEDCVLSLLKENELKIAVPSRAIVPRTFVLRPGMVLFLGALGRIDFLMGEKSAWFSVIASNLLPVHITHLEKADDIYQKHAGKTLLRVPMGGEERMKEFPPLVPQDVELEGIGPLEAVADIKLSSIGWVAVTAHLKDRLQLRAYTPAGLGLMVRQPPLLPHIVHIKGERIKKSPAYKTKKPEPLVENIHYRSRAKTSLKK